MKGVVYIAGQHALMAFDARVAGINESWHRCGRPPTKTSSFVVLSERQELSFGRHRGGRREAGARLGHAGPDHYIEKLVPQPQDEVAFGLLTLNAWPIRSSTKSISAPLRKSSDTGSIRTRRAVALDDEVVVHARIVDGEIVLKARAAAAGHRQAQHRGRGSVFRISAMRLAARAETVTGRAVSMLMASYM